MYYSTIFLLGLGFLMPGAAALAGGTGAVRIFSLPGDAELSVDGERKGRSPATAQESFLINLAPGEHRISAVKKGFNPVERKVFVAAGTDQTIKLDLAPQIVMIAVPGGCFLMGSPETEAERDRDEGPQHEVCIKPFELAKYEVTFDDWDACVTDGGCARSPDDEGWGRGKRPVINVSWNDMQEYIRWLNRTGGMQYRLPSEAEWEYAARAGTVTPFSTGACINTKQGNFDGTFDYAQCGTHDGTDLGKTVEIGSYPPNPWGLHDIHGNVNELTEDCWNDGYDGAPNDGSAWVQGNCSRRVIRGGSWYGYGGYTRSAYRCRSGAGFAHRSLGFRLARTTQP
ncbi:MAG TPA: SUMF1/EgtB/PvdO family nonheme iron enzyme [Lamprocystis sp. (in: g-proteobacteria)]|nr:SUMF1/EgtB/PvdO family nonheme iron enzyme [Lamprocystis sp. (in: g-proteobacteria)]